MSSTWNRMKRMLGAAVPVSIAVLTLTGGTANAQLTLEGSDTLTEIIQNAIIASGSSAALKYNNIGSGQAEKNMLGTGNFVQSIGPMSRNFVPTVLSAHTTWAPSDANVLALDAGIIGVANIAGRCQNVTATLADPNNPAIAQITTDLSIILSGYSGTDGVKSKATTAECAHPRRLQALAALTACQGVNRIDHIYRRDDKSGTQDTFREHLQFDRWCNGKSEGNNNLSGSNLKNEDLDPIRRPCIGADAATAATTCSYYPLTTKCTAGAPDLTGTAYGTIKCTQGLIVALSENDPGIKDHTLSIAQRVANDLNGYTMGLAGKAMVDLAGAPNVGTNINTVTYEDGNVRAGQYMLSRRLFLQRNPSGTNPAVDPTRFAAETAFFNWTANKCNLRQIVLDAGFLPPLATCSAACDDPLNITCLTADAGVGTPKQNIGAEGSAALASSNTYPCVADGVVLTSGTCPVLPVLASTYKCNLSQKCTSGTCNLDATLLSGACQ